MTVYTLMLFQAAYPEQIEIYKCDQGGGRIYAQFWLLNEDKNPHMLLIDGVFPSEEAVDQTVQKWLIYKLCT